jgi:ornithine cyclodeaminase/alanine dehydrogenase
VTRLIDTATVERYLTTEVALDAMRRCFTLEAAGAMGPARRLDLPHPSGWMRVLPAVSQGLGVFGHKIISFHREVGVRYVITLYSIETGDLLAVVDGEAITGARTGATSALAADLLAPPSIEVGAIVGTGSVARTQLPALQAVRPVRELRVFSRRPENRAGFIAEMQPTLDVRLVDCSGVEEAIEGAGLVTLATKSPDPVLFARHLSSGLHVNSVGSARPNLSEVDPAAFAAFDRVVCDSVDLVFDESGDAIAAEDQGLFARSDASDLAAVLDPPPERRPEEITLFKSTGSGLQDLSLAVAVLDAAAADEAGTVVDELVALKAFGPTGRT